MDKWIEKLKTKNGLIDPDVGDPEDTAIYYINSDSKIVLHDEFSIQQLESLIKYMKQYSKE